jgi:hypothetical protein
MPMLTFRTGSFAVVAVTCLLAGAVSSSASLNGERSGSHDYFKDITGLEIVIGVQVHRLSVLTCVSPAVDSVC